MKLLKMRRKTSPDESIGVSMFSLNLMLEEPTTDICPLDAEQMSKLCSHVLQHQRLLTLESVNQVEMSVQMLDIDAMRALNAQYRQRDAATNVLSFESAMPVLSNDENDAFLALGDLVFCPQVISQEADQQEKTEDAHWVHMLVHGTLHLCGYDHIEPADAEQMEELEKQILSRHGLPDPYENRTTS